MLEELRKLLEDNYKSVWFTDHGYTVHFGVGEDRVVYVNLVGPREVRLSGPGHLLMDLEETLGSSWTIV